MISVDLKLLNFRESAKDQKELLYEIFSYIRTFQSWIIGEVSWFQSIIFYTVSCIICALFSSSRRTADARITLFSILSLNIVAERILVQYYDKIIPQLPDDKVMLQNFQINFLSKITTPNSFTDAPVEYNMVV